MPTIDMIATRDDYERSMKRLSTLMAADPKPDSMDDIELRSLALLLKDYEERQGFFPSTPVEASAIIRYCMEENDLTVSDLFGVFENEHELESALAGKCKLTDAEIVKLNQTFGIPIRCLV